MRKKIIDSYINIDTFDSFIDKLFSDFLFQASSYVCFANVHSIVTAKQNPKFNDVLDKADFVAPDGRALTIYLKLVQGINQDRIAGMDVLPKVLERANIHKSAVYFYGGEQSTLDRIDHIITTNYPNVRIAGMYSPPFRELTNEEQIKIIDDINTTEPDFVFVSLGCPKQEFWMATHKNKIQACMLGLGQAFKTFSGEEKRLPKQLRNFKWFPLEWLYRLWLEPKRLWKRYFYTNSMFIVLVIRKGLTGMVKPKK